MQIAHILRKYNPDQWGGTETAVLRLLNGLNSLGVEGTLHCPKSADIKDNDPLAHAAKAIRPYHPVLPVSGISQLHRDQLYSWGGNLFSFNLIWNLLTEKRLELIHSHALNRLAGIGMLVARLRRVPFVITLHGGSLDLPMSAHEQLTAPLKGGFEWGKALGWLVRSRRVLEKADAVITCNPREAALLRERYPHQRIVVEPHAVPATRYAQDCRETALKAFPQIAGRDVIIKLARIDPVKNHAWLVTELPRMIRDEPKTLLVFAGSTTDPEMERYLKSEIERLNLQNHVLFTGAIEPGSDTLIGLLQCSKAMVLASTAETFGIVIIEAWAAGLPVLSSRTSGAASLIRNGHNGFLFDLNEPEDFHASLQLLDRSPLQRNTICRNARAEVVEKFSLESAAQRMRSLYEELRGIN